MVTNNILRWPFLLELPAIHHPHDASGVLQDGLLSCQARAEQKTMFVKAYPFIGDAVQLTVNSFLNG